MANTNTIEMKLGMTGTEKVRSDLNAVTGDVQRFSGSMLDSAKQLLAWVGIGATIASVSYAIKQAVYDSTMLAARYETLGVAMQVVGNNSGYTGKQMEIFAQGLEKAGISMSGARESLTRMTQAQLDLTKSSNLARVAQDAAVIGNINSSEAFQRLVYGIQSAQVEMLRTVGINVNFENSYQKVAETTGRAATSFSESEKAAIRMNAVLEAGKGIAGTYEAAMGTTGKQMLSLERHFENLKVLAGEAFTPALAEIIETITGAVTDLNGKLSGEGKDAIAEWGTNFRIGIIQVEAELMRLSMFLDKIGGTMTSAKMFLYGPGNALGIESSVKRFQAAADANMEYEKRYYDTEKALQGLANKQVKLEESLTVAGKAAIKTVKDLAEGKRMAADLIAYEPSQYGYKPGKAGDEETAKKQADKTKTDSAELMKIYEDVYGKGTQTYIRLTEEMNAKILTMEDDKLKQLYEKNLVNTYKVTSGELIEYQKSSDYIASIRETILANEGIQAWTARLRTLFTTDWPTFMGVSAARYKELDRLMNDLDMVRVDKKLKLEEETQAKIIDATISAQTQIAAIIKGFNDGVAAQALTTAQSTAIAITTAYQSSSDTFFGRTTGNGLAFGTPMASSGNVGEYTGLPQGVNGGGITGGGYYRNTVTNNNYAAQAASAQAEQRRLQDEAIRAQAAYQAEQKRLWEQQIAAQKKFVDSLKGQSQSVTEWLSEMNRGSLAPVTSENAWTVEYLKRKESAMATATTAEEESAKAQAVSSFLSYAKDYLEFVKTYRDSGSSYRDVYSQVISDISGLGTIKSVEEMLAAAGLGTFESDLRKVIKAFNDAGASTNNLKLFMDAYNLSLTQNGGVIPTMEQVQLAMVLASGAAGGTAKTVGDAGGLSDTLQNTKTPFDNVLAAFNALIGTSGTTGLSSVDAYFKALATALGTSYTSVAGTATGAAIKASAPVQYQDRIVEVPAAVTYSYWSQIVDKGYPGQHTHYYKTNNMSGVVAGPSDSFIYGKGGLTSGLSFAGEIGPEWVVPTYEPERSSFLQSVGADPDVIAERVTSRIGSTGGNVDTDRIAQAVAKGVSAAIGQSNGKVQVVFQVGDKVLGDVMVDLLGPKAHKQLIKAVQRTAGFAN